MWENPRRLFNVYLFIVMVCMKYNVSWSNKNKMDKENGLEIKDHKINRTLGKIALKNGRSMFA